MLAVGRRFVKKIAPKEGLLSPAAENKAFVYLQLERNPETARLDTK